MKLRKVDDDDDDDDDDDNNNNNHVIVRTIRGPEHRDRSKPLRITVFCKRFPVATVFCILKIFHKIFKQSLAHFAVNTPSSTYERNKIRHYFLPKLVT